VGLNANKNWLPHYVFGAPESGGDQFPVMTVKRSLENMLVERIKKKLTKNNSFIAILSRKFKNLGYHIFGNTEVDTIRSGNWHGNDTIWRTCLDLNRILLYYQVKENIWNSNDPKPFLSIVDGIIAMEGNGPVAGDPKHSGIIVIGDNPVSVDIVCAKIMGFDHEKIPLISRALDNHVYQLIHGNVRDISVVSGNTLWNKALAEIIYEDSLKFKPAFGWIGHL
jgi:hypothetical protein